MVFVDNFGFVHLAHIEGVAVGVIVAYCEVDGFDGIEAQSHGFVGQRDFLDRRFSSQIV